MPDPDPHQSEIPDPDPHRTDSDPHYRTAAEIDYAEVYIFSNDHERDVEV